MYLNDPAAISVSAEFVDLSLEGVDDEREGLRVDLLDALLYHVVTVLVQHALQDVAF